MQLKYPYLKFRIYTGDKESDEKIIEHARVYYITQSIEEFNTFMKLSIFRNGSAWKFPWTDWNSADLARDFWSKIFTRHLPC